MVAIAGCGGSAAPTTASASASGQGGAAAQSTASAAATGSAAAPQRGGTLTVALNSDPPGLDPMWQTATVTQDVDINVVEQLFTFDKNNGFTPLLVDSYTVSPDGKTFIFKLRQGVLFQDGSEMTSADVLASFQRWEALSSRAQALLQNMTAATAPDPSTFEVQFSQPNGAFISALAIPNQQMFILEKKQIDQFMSGGKYQQIPGAQLIGTGPYKIQSWQPGRELDLVRFDKYVSPSGPTNGLAGTRHAYVDTIKYMTVPDPASTLAGLAAGQYDVAYTLPTSLYSEVQAQSGLVPEIVKPGSSPVAVFNKKQGPFTSVALRQAAWYAIDPAKVMAGAIDNKAFYSMNPSLADQNWAVWYNDTAGASVYTGAPDVAKAKQLLQQAGYSGQQLTWITTKDYDYMYNSALVASQEMQQAGLNVKLQVYDWPTLVSMRNNPKDYDIFSTGIGFVGDPTGTAAFTPGWPGWFDDSENNANYQALTTTVDPAKRVQLAAQQQTIFWDKLPYLQFGHMYNFRAYRSSVQNMINGPVFALFNVGIKP